MHFNFAESHTKSANAQVRRSVSFLTILCVALSSTLFAPSSRADAPAQNFLSLDRTIVNRGFLEVAPVISQVVIKKGDPFIEVFINGDVPEGDCYDKKEFIVEALKDETQVIARFRRLNPEQPCRSKIKSFSEKVADLDPNNPASKVVQVLGYYGWTRGELTEGAPK